MYCGSVYIMSYCHETSPSAELKYVHKQSLMFLAVTEYALLPCLFRDMNPVLE